MKIYIERLELVGFELVSVNKSVITMRRTLYLDDALVTQILTLDAKNKIIEFDDMGFPDAITEDVIYKKWRW
mgnify:CR=1 FL=1